MPRHTTASKTAIRNFFMLHLLTIGNAYQPHLSRRMPRKVPCDSESGLINWNANMKQRAVPVARCAQRSGADDFLHAFANECEAESDATLPRCEERLPNLFAQFSRNTPPVVLHVHQQHAVRRRST